MAQALPSLDSLISEIKVEKYEFEMENSIPQQISFSNATKIHSPTLTDVLLAVQNLTSKMENIEKRVHRLEDTIKVMARDIKIIKSSVNKDQIEKDEHFSFNHFFPLLEESKLLDVETRLEDESFLKPFVAYLKADIGHKSITQVLNDLFSQELMLEYNYEGIKGKKTLKNFKIIKALNLATNLTHTNFKKEIKLAIKNMHHSIHVKKSKSKLQNAK